MNNEIQQARRILLEKIEEKKADVTRLKASLIKTKVEIQVLENEISALKAFLDKMEAEDDKDKRGA